VTLELNPEKAETIIATAGKTHIEKFTKDKAEDQKKKEEKARRDAEKKKAEEADKSRREAADEQTQAALLEQLQRQEREKAAQKPPLSPDAQANPEAKKEEKEESKAPPGNGAVTDQYVWTQTLTEVHVSIPIAESVTKKDLTVQFLEDRLLVAVKGLPAPVLDGPWPEKIDVPSAHQVDECLWTLVGDKGKKLLNLEIAKFKTYQGWWNCVVKGEPTIDTSKINPEPSKLSDLDGEMKGQVEKMMFDMRQKQKGEPSSDELLKRDKL